MKFNWGTGIALFFTLFAGSMIFAVISTTKHPPQMVQKDYYNLDLNYQARLEQKQNTAALATEPSLQYNADQKNIHVALPEGMTAQSGKVKCFRSATTREDYNAEIGAGQNAVTIQSEKFTSGRWHVEMEWVANDGKPYYWESTVSVH